MRTKNYPLVAPPPEPGKLDAFKAAVQDAVARFAADYHAYFAGHNPRQPVPKRELDPMPRVILVPGLGLFGLGGNAKDARIAADIAEATVATVTDAEAVGRFAPVGEADMFDIEYWSLEQAKLGQAAEKPLAGQVAVVTGGAGTIGFAIARATARAGAEVALFDIDGDTVAASAKKLGGASLGLACDVTDPIAVRVAFDRVAETFGGVDIVVSNAGAAWQGRIGEVGDACCAELTCWLGVFFPAHRGRAKRGAHHAGARNRRRPAVQRVAASREPRAERRPMGSCSCRNLFWT